MHSRIILQLVILRWIELCLYAIIKRLIARTNTPGEYQNLITRYEGAPNGSGGCSSCAYDPLGNPLAVTDPRGFTTVYARNEMGVEYRRTSPAPYLNQVEKYFDANGNIIRQDTEDQQVAFISEDPTDAAYSKFFPSGNAEEGPANVPLRPGEGGEIRPGWFTNLYAYDLLDNRIEEDIDATGSEPNSLVTRYQYDANENLTKTIKPEGNTVEYDYDERNLRIAQRIGYIETDEYPPAIPGSVNVWVYDGNGNLIQSIGPAQRGSAGAGTSDNWWADDASQANYAACEVLFCGYRFDPESKLYQVRNREYDPQL